MNRERLPVYALLLSLLGGTTSYFATDLRAALAVVYQRAGLALER